MKYLFIRIVVYFKNNIYLNFVIICIKNIYALENLLHSNKRMNKKKTKME